jgi:hypothetical protein
LIRGYITGLLTASPEQATSINLLVDTLEQDDPEIAVEVILGALEVSDPATRIVRMLRAGRIGVEAMQLVLYGETLQRLSSEQFGDLLGVFEDANTTPQGLKIASDIIGSRLSDPHGQPLRESPDTLNRILAVLDKSATVENRGDFWWADALSKLAGAEPAKVARIAALAITGEDYDKKESGAKLLASIAQSYPEVVMSEIGPRILETQSGWEWQTESLKGIFAALAPPVVMEWLDHAGAEGARRIARHLPSPFVDREGRPVVPELTEQVLSRFGEAEQVFGRFCAGGHHLETSWGNPADTDDAHARTAEPFLNHPLAIIRRWAAQEIASSRSSAAMWRKMDEDEGFQ